MAQETPAPNTKTLHLEPTTDKAVFRVAGSKLFLSGAANYWNDLGNNVDFLLRNYRSGTHLHIEYFPDHWFLDASSVPAVLELM